MFEQWQQLNDWRLMDSAEEYDEARRKFVDDMAGPGPRLSEEFELVELNVGEESEDWVHVKEDRDHNRGANIMAPGIRNP
jgi:hypothetical protein